MWTRPWSLEIPATTRRIATALLIISILASRSLRLFSNSSFPNSNSIRPDRVKIASNQPMYRALSIPTTGWCRPWMTKSTASSNHTHKYTLLLEPLGWSPWTRQLPPKWFPSQCPATTRSMSHKITPQTTMGRRVVKDSRNINRYTCWQNRPRLLLTHRVGMLPRESTRSLIPRIVSVHTNPGSSLPRSSTRASTLINPGLRNISNSLMSNNSLSSNMHREKARPLQDLMSSPKKMGMPKWFLKSHQMCWERTPQL